MKMTKKECITRLLEKNRTISRWDELEKFTTVELEEMALSLHERPSPEKELQNVMLKVRKYRMNRQFVYTQEHIRQILSLNKKIMDALEMLCCEAEEELRQMHERKCNNDLFLHDFSVECKLTPDIFVKDEETGNMYEVDEGIDALLIDTLPEHVLWWFEGGTPEDLRDHLYFSKDLNWNECDGLSNGELSDYYIGYGLHELYDHTNFSLFDILRINWMWAEVKPLREHFIKNIIL
jgi:hypothetical protein